MTNVEFSKIVDKMLDRSRDIFVSKTEEYDLMPRDRFRQFKVAAALQNLTPKQALCGMMCKHVTSIFDMVDTDDDYPIEKWDEKITDNINYLLLLRGLIEEEKTDG